MSATPTSPVSFIGRRPACLVTLGVCLGLAWLTFGVFGQTTRFGFLNFDDDLYISHNPKLTAGLSVPGIEWAFGANLTQLETGAEYWEPLTLLSRLADVQFFGTAPGQHHRSNMLYHLTAGLVLFGALKQLLGSTARSAVIAALFLVHPLHVEPVAWLSARKDILNGLFYFATIWAYAWYAARPGWRRYLVVGASFLCANMAKPMAVSLPLVLLLLDYWPLRRLVRPVSPRRAYQLILEKLPLMAVAVAISLLAILDQQRQGAMGDDGLYPLNVRLGNAAISYCVYLGQTIVPSGLAIFYPHPGTAISWPLVAASSVCLLLITAVFLYQAKRRPWLIVGWGWFVVALLPVSGIVQIGEMARADRYVYVALVGIFLLGAQQVSEWTRLWREGHRGTDRLATLGAVALLATSSFLAWRQTATWRDSTTVFTHAIAVTEDNYIAEANLGAALFAEGRKEEGLRHYEEAVRLHAPVLAYHRQEGASAEARGDLPGAIHHYEKVITLVPADSSLHQRLGDLLFRTRDYGKALGQYNEVLRNQRNAIPPRLGIVRTLIAQGRFPDARWMIDVILRLDPANQEAAALLRSL